MSEFSAVDLICAKRAEQELGPDRVPPPGSMSDFSAVDIICAKRAEQELGPDRVPPQDL